MVDQVLGSLINPASPLSTTSGFTTNNVVLTVGSTVSVGLWSPNTNTLALNTNSTQVITINSTGNVGIATSNPSATLHVVGPGTAVGSRGLIARFVDAVHALGGNVTARRTAEAHRLAAYAPAAGLAQLEAAMQQRLDPAGVLA